MSERRIFFFRCGESIQATWSVRVARTSSCHRYAGDVCHKSKKIKSPHKVKINVMTKLRSINGRNSYRSLSLHGRLGFFFFFSLVLCKTSFPVGFCHSAVKGRPSLTCFSSSSSSLGSVLCKVCRTRGSSWIGSPRKVIRFPFCISVRARDAMTTHHALSILLPFNNFDASFFHRIPLLVFFFLLRWWSTQKPVVLH